jgi:hypothetical protein
MVYADARMTGDTPFAGRTFMDTTPSVGPVTFRSLLSQQCTVLTSSVVARRDILEAAGRFDASLRRGQDFDLWIRLAHRGCRIALTTRSRSTHTMESGVVSGAFSLRRQGSSLKLRDLRLRPPHER